MTNISNGTEGYAGTSRYDEARTGSRNRWWTLAKTNAWEECQRLLQRADLHIPETEPQRYVRANNGRLR